MDKYTLIYVRDLKPGNRFQLKEGGPVLQTDGIKGIVEECPTCGSAAIEKVRIGIPGGYITLEPDTAVRLIEQAKRSGGAWLDLYRD